MPLRTTANNRQRKFFNNLFNIDELVLTIKAGELCSMNAHGSFIMFDKHWYGVEYRPNETMIALKENEPVKTSSEPSVHFHIDWNEVRYVSIRRRRLELINTDFEVVFCKARDINTRVLWFYTRYNSSLRWLIANWGKNWINLSEESATTPVNKALNNNIYLQSFLLTEMHQY